jgi:flagellar hook assembly protein FlgD
MLAIYDVSGRLVTTPFSGALSAGPQTIRWDGRTAGGALAAHGLYFARLSTPKATETIKFLILGR